MMNAMCNYPVDGSAFKCEQSAEREEVFHGFRSFVAAMSQQPVKAHSDSETAGYPPEHEGHWNHFPTKHKKRGHRRDVENDHEHRRVPLNLALLVRIS